MSKINVLTISIDVSNLSQSQIEDLQTAMEVQTEDYDAPILNSGLNELDVDELMEETDSGLH